jgi:hypothetical protein
MGIRGLISTGLGYRGGSGRSLGVPGRTMALRVVGAQPQESTKKKIATRNSPFIINLRIFY